MGTVSDTGAGTRDDAAATSECTPSAADGSHPGATRSSHGDVAFDAWRDRIRAIWPRPAAKVGLAVLAVMVLAVSVPMLSTVRSHPSSGSAGPTTPPGAADRAGSPPRTGAASRVSPGQAASLTSLEDAAGRYALFYPSTWTEVTTPAERSEAGGARVIRISGESAFSIRTFPLSSPVSGSNVSDLRAVTDAILSAPDAKLQVLDVRKVDVGGLPAVYYLYYFADGKRRGIHAHYFIFDRRRMHSLVFQVVPAGDFATYAATFDDVIASFRRLDP